MGGIFSHHRHPHHNNKRRPASNKVQITDHDRAVLDLKTAKDRLKRYQVKMRAESSRLTAQATELVQAGRKDRALLVLKMRRLREEESQKAEAQLLNVEKLISQIEWETEQLKVFDALKSGNRVLEAMHQIMSLEEVERLMADTQDAIEYEQEVSRMLSANLSSASEEEVLKEFQALEAELAPAPATLVEPGAAPAVAAPAAAAAAAPAAVAAVAAKPEKEEGEGEGEKPLELPAVPTHALPTVEPAAAAEAEEAEGEAKPTERRRAAKEKVAVMG